MKLILGFIATVFLGFMMNSCIKHEVIPAPIATVDLNASFESVINGTDVEWTQNVEGYKATAKTYAVYLPSPQLSRKIFQSEISSVYSEQSINLTFGSLTWDVASNIEPTLSMFNNYHSYNSDAPIVFKNYSSLSTLPSMLGVEVEYIDNNGVSWISRESDINQFAKFTILDQDSDNTGDYSLFLCEFSCKVWRINPQTLLDESIIINNAKYTAWFKR